MTWLGVFPLLTLILSILGPVMERWPLVARTFAVSVLMIIALTWVVLPALMRLFRRWLSG
ncbi:MAG: hypothetical protein H0U52_16750 [Chloroflexi bacterium]|nr:hypothetical protein [Chloroflexota bacterium]